MARPLPCSPPDLIDDRNETLANVIKSDTPYSQTCRIELDEARCKPVFYASIGCYQATYQSFYVETAPGISEGTRLAFNAPKVDALI